MWGDSHSPRSGGSSSQEEILRNGFEKAGHANIAGQGGAGEAGEEEEGGIFRLINFPAARGVGSDVSVCSQLDGHGVTHLDLAAHGTVSLSRCSTANPAHSSGSVHSLPGFTASCAVPPGPNVTLLPHPQSVCPPAHYVRSSR